MDWDARMLALRFVGLSIVISTTAAAIAAQPRSTAGRITVSWIGQDGQDFVGPTNRLEPSDVQDIHLTLGGLNPNRAVTFVDITGEGGDQWNFNQDSFAWKAHLQRSPGSRTAELYIEPARVERGRSFQITVRYEDGSTVQSSFRGRTASPRLRMPSAKLTARWIGQNGSDWTGAGLSIGADRLQDACLQITGISTKIEPRSLLIEDQGGARWESGVNPKLHHNAELIRDSQNRSVAMVCIQPTRDIRGSMLKLTLTYANDTVDTASVTAGPFDPSLRTTVSPMPQVLESSPIVEWIGQDGQASEPLGSVHLKLKKLDGMGSIAGVVLTDSIQTSWVYRSEHPLGRAFHADDYSEPLQFRMRGDRPGEADLFFLPLRDETGARMTLRLIFEDGRMALAQFPGGLCDPGLRIPRPDNVRLEAKPGDDLHALCKRSGTIVLSPGTYRLTRPLVLERPITLTSEGDATLLFAQAPNDEPWTTAIKVHCGHSTLDRFRVRFEGPIRWRDQISYGPAVVGLTDNFDQGFDAPKFNLTFSRLDLESPPPADPRNLPEATRLMRLWKGRSGTVASNTLRGGMIEFLDGPWVIENNRSLGTIPNTSSAAVFSGHLTHKLRLKGNWAEPAAGNGKVWRFLVLTVKGNEGLISENTIKRIGPRDDDKIPWANAPEIILTEAYRLTYEGAVMGLTAGGRILRTGSPQGMTTETGAVVSILSGPAAGTWRRIAQVIDSTTYVLDEPIPSGTELVSVCRGFVGMRFDHNTIDTRGGQRATNLVLVGNLFDTRVVKNYLLGGEAFKLAACPTEEPVVWGWSRAPFLGAIVSDNLIEDPVRGGFVVVEHDPKHSKPTRGRVYMSAQVDRNVIRWSQGFVARMPRSKASSLQAGLTLGVPSSLDPGELRIAATGNRVDVPTGSTNAPILSIPSAEFNASKIVRGEFRFPGDPSLEAQTSESRPVGSRATPSSR